MQVIDVGLLRAYAEVIITGDDSRRPTNRTPLDRHGGGGYVSHVALVAMYPDHGGSGCTCFPAASEQEGSRDVLLCIPATADSEGSLCTCCFVSRPPLTTRAPASRVALRPPLLWRQ